MFLKSLELKNFRNYSELSQRFTAKKTLIVGKNAQGKTNILEAVYYLSSLNSAKIKSDSELIKWGENFCTIKSELVKSDTDIKLEVIINPPSKKVLKVNDIKKTKSSEFAGILSVVNFASSDLALLRGQPEDRRRWLDLAISQVYPAYLERLSKYNKIRIQKNNFLKELKINPQKDEGLLDIWNTQMAISGSNILYLRLKFLKEIEKSAVNKHCEIIPTETLSISYQASIGEEKEIEPNMAAEEISKIFEVSLEKRRNDELIRAQSLVGPHRDDVSFYIDGMDAEKFASQGQQRTIVLALKLAELDIIREKTQHSPLLLLDDVLAELDETRQNYLLSAINDDVQTIITSTDVYSFKEEFLRGVEILTVEDAKIKSGTLNLA